MKRIIYASIFSLTLVAGAAGVRAQGGGVAKGPDPAVVSDPEEEKEALHNLEVARHYFKLKKAYVAATTRAEETIAGYPNFSRMDEALYIAGMSNLLLSEGKGKQKSTIAPDKLREEARNYLSRLVTEFPDSDFANRAKDELQKLGGPKTNAKPDAGAMEKP
jgi:outer membrane protein assembly factor BamD (BamD/ComL family)